MLELLWDALSEEAFDLSIAAVLGVVSLAIPFRRLNARPELLWDFIGLVCVVAFAYAVTFVLDVSLDWLYDVSELAASAWYDFIRSLHGSVVVVSYVLLADFAAYWAHRALHTRLLWNQHAWHHSSQRLYWGSGLRGSFLDTLVLFTPYSLAYLIFPRTEAGIVGAALFILDVGNQHFIHSNITIPFARQVERVFVTPRYHFVHHSAHKALGNSNYGFIFTFWDRLLGTYTDPETVPPDDPLGLGYEAANWRLLLGLPPVKRAPSASLPAAHEIPG